MEKLLKLQETLIKLGYKAEAFQTAEEAKTYLCSVITNTTVGFGGSMTLQHMELYPALQEKNTVLWHAKGDKLREANGCESYISSVNGIAETGEIVNIDGTGNRVSACIYGPERVFLLVPSQKIEETLEKAIWRARNIAAPKNAQRLQRKTPCAKNGDRCYDCKSPERICRSMVVHFTAPGGNSTEVILIKENLGY